MALAIVRELLGLALLAAAGSGFVAARGGSVRPSPDALCLRALVGLALAVPIVFAIGLAGLPVGAATVAGVEVALLAAGLALRRRSRPAAEASAPGPPAAIGAADVLIFLALFAFALKVARVPIWCWDHDAVFGLKARRLLPGGFLDLTFLQDLVPLSNPDYPLGLPVAWRVLALGAVPSALDFKVAHVFFGAAVVLLTRRALVQAGVSRRIAGAAAAFVAVSPLLWDTESLGIAEIALAAAALAAVTLRFDANVPGGVAGAMLGLLPWIKKEGLTLGLALLLADVLFAPRRSGSRSRLAAAAAFALLAAAALLVERELLPRGLSFFAGDWGWRVRQRLPRIGLLFGDLAGELLLPDWLGFWVAAAAALAAALVRRARAALGLFAVVLAQAGLYAFTYAATYLSPIAHVRASFVRVMAALLPLAAVGVGLGVSPDFLTFQRPRDRAETRFQKGG